MELRRALASCCSTFCVHPAGRRREDIGLAFWPDASAAQVKNSFHVLLHRLRKILGGSDVVIVDDERYRINPVTRTRGSTPRMFEHEVTAARQRCRRLERAVELYRGDLFEGGEVAGEWYFARQERLRMLYRDALSDARRSAPRGR